MLVFGRKAMFAQPLVHAAVVGGASAGVPVVAGDAAKARVFGLIAAAHQNVPGVARGLAHARAVDDGKFLVEHIVQHPLARLTGAQIKAPLVEHAIDAQLRDQAW